LRLPASPTAQLKHHALVEETTVEELQDIEGDEVTDELEVKGKKEERRKETGGERSRRKR
jgi:hypothetical protein